jgi:hypothetical protein
MVACASTRGWLSWMRPVGAHVQRTDSVRVADGPRCEGLYPCRPRRSLPSRGAQHLPEPEELPGRP